MRAFRNTQSYGLYFSVPQIQVARVQEKNILAACLVKSTIFKTFDLCVLLPTNISIAVITKNQTGGSSGGNRKSTDKAHPDTEEDEQQQPRNISTTVLLQRPPVPLRVLRTPTASHGAAVPAGSRSVSGGVFPGAGQGGGERLL